MNTGIISEWKKSDDKGSYHPLEQREDPYTPFDKKKVLIISGPTATGKTKLSLVLAKAVDGEIISADSMQVYRGMDIGTAKATLEERTSVPHHLIDIRNVTEPFNVADFYREAWAAARDILARGKVPIVVGGTGFYIHSFIYGPPKGPPSVPEIRKKLEEDMSRFGTEILYEKLKEYDPLYASTITGGDRHKIVRALEIITITNQKVSDFGMSASEIENPNYDFRCWFMYYEREILYPRIEQRCEQMLANNFVEEVLKLREQGIQNNSSTQGAIGYRQCLDYLEKEASEENWIEFTEAFKTASRRYAKRQFTWFRKEPLFRWLDMEKYSFHQSAEIILQDFELND